MDQLTINAASGMRSRLDSLEMLANNLSNANTAGYKADREFYSLYESAESTGETTLPVVEKNWIDLQQGLLDRCGIDVHTIRRVALIAPRAQRPIVERRDDQRRIPKRQGDTTVPVLAKGKCRTGRLCTHVHDDRPFGGSAVPAAVDYYSATREGEQAERQLAAYTGICQADAYSGFNDLFVEGRTPGPIIEAACGAHSRRKFFELARLRKMPIAIEAVTRIDALFAIEREINGRPAAQRHAVRQARSKPLLDSFVTWLRGERKKLSAKGPLAKAIDYTFNHWKAFMRFLDDGRICLSNNAVERSIRSIAVGRRNWTFLRLRHRRPTRRCHFYVD